MVSESSDSSTKAFHCLQYLWSQQLSICFWEFEKASAGVSRLLSRISAPRDWAVRIKELLPINLYVVIIFVGVLRILCFLS